MIINRLIETENKESIIKTNGGSNPNKRITIIKPFEKDNCNDLTRLIKIVQELKD